jgi:hypothetical protein
MNHDLADLLRTAPRECWLALSADQTRIVASSKDFSAAVAEAQRSGVDDPIMMWSPREWIPIVA